MNHPTTIVVPGRGVHNIDAAAVNRAVEAHDERLRFGWNEKNGDWVVYIKMPPNFQAEYFIDGSPVYPILGFGKSIPAPGEAIARLNKADTRQRGNNVLDRMNKENEKLQAFNRSGDEAATQEAAERIEFETRKAGLTEKYAKIFMN